MRDLMFSDPGVDNAYISEHLVDDGYIGSYHCIKSVDCR